MAHPKPPLAVRRQSRSYYRRASAHKVGEGEIHVQLFANFRAPTHRDNAEGSTISSDLPRPRFPLDFSWGREEKNRASTRSVDSRTDIRWKPKEPSYRWLPLRWETWTRSMLTDLERSVATFVFLVGGFSRKFTFSQLGWSDYAATTFLFYLGIHWRFLSRSNFIERPEVFEGLWLRCDFYWGKCNFSDHPVDRHSLADFAV